MLCPYSWLVWLLELNLLVKTVHTLFWDQKQPALEYMTYNLWCIHNIHGRKQSKFTLEILLFFVWLSVQFSCSVVSDSLQPHGLQHTRPPCPSPAPGVYSNSCPSSQWCHPTISSSVVPFPRCLQSFPASGSFQMNQLFASDGQRIGASASTSILPMNTRDWSPLGWTGWISLQSLKSLLQHLSSKASNRPWGYIIFFIPVACMRKLRQSEAK